MERYDATAAAHYAAYRPPLHAMILARLLGEGESFGVGLDVGCGTGYSAAALAEYCTRVYGLDSSSSMLSKASPHERVSYLGAAAERIPLPRDSVDVVTFAGSLFYADSAATHAEVRRVGREGAMVLAYDFELLLDEALRLCGVTPAESGSDYDHRRNFSGTPGFADLLVGGERVAVPVSTPQLAHLLLSDSNRFDQLSKRYGSPDPFPELAGALRTVYTRSSIDADLYYSMYRLTT